MFAVTERLLLRPGWPEDAHALAAALGDREVVRNLARVPWPYGLGDAAELLARERPAGAIPDFLIFTRVNARPRLVGGIGFGEHEGATEIGYWIARAEWGRGYATEAGRALLATARDGLRLPRLGAGHMIDNPASGAVLRKLGFRPTGAVRPRFSRARGETVPTVEYAWERDTDRSGPAAVALAA
ncbi:MAG: 50S ribosomal protein acetyltransferase [uncultured Sphingomonadaceae bacterium]|uniref:50S ribosomal protein acetyltransferase n=1 Tax=uncultured Sphingomonadaceae bacterium TaxID=169976 RepID=A0A6J4TC32_9SPHN|nr:MAG: 50S ribosomal protein acetyltransferase [uncultured Sphingomonadaceae bacterium]